MGTSSYIGKVTKDGKNVEYIYCHWDGYVDGVGAELLKSFNSEEAIDALIQEGNHSSIAGEHVSYRSMGRDGDQFNHYTSSIEEFRTSDCQDQNYTYLFIEGHWIFTQGTPRGWSVLNVFQFPE